jgi:hypothetical protein
MSSKEKGLEEIEKIEKIVKAKTISIVIAIITIIALVYLFRPDLPKTVADTVINSTRMVVSRIKSEFNTTKEEESGFKDISSEPTQDPGVLLEIGVKHSFRGNSYLLTMVSDKGTFCRISINGDIYVMTNETSRIVGGAKLQILEAYPPPVETCRVRLT